MKDMVTEMQKKEQLARALMICRTVFDKVGSKWFVSFGALLYFIRDKKMGLPFEQDIDISIVGPCNTKQLIQFMDEWSYKPKNMTVNDITKQPMHIVFTSDSIPFAIDVFVWINHNGYWWHTYDYYGENKKIPSKYVFKGTPEWAMKGEEWKYIWEEIAGDMRFPFLYGSLLDIWYPGWFVPDRNFGQSKGKQVTVKTCKDLEKELK